jgi:antitoxin component of MazEF toxin-antitoxin module
MEIGRSHCITLPVEFVKELKLEKGEELYIDLAGNIVLVAKLDSIKEKEPIGMILRLLSDMIKIETKLDKELKKYREGKLSDFEFISKIGEASSRVREIASSLKQLSNEKVQPIKKKLDLKFVDPKVNVDELIAGVKALIMEGYKRHLGMLYSEIMYMIEQRKMLDKVLQKIDKTLHEHGIQVAKSLILIKLECKRKKDLIDETLAKITHLIQAS